MEGDLHLETKIKKKTLSYNNIFKISVFFQEKKENKRIVLDVSTEFLWREEEEEEESSVLLVLLSLRMA